MKKAFTLAEILITLAIIGIVAAMTIPTLITKLKNQRTEAILKEDYSILQQMMISANDEGAIENLAKDNNMDAMESWFKAYFLPYIKVAHVCYDEAGCWSSNVKKLNNTIKSANDITGCGIKTISFILNNGSFVCMDDYDKNSLINLYGVETSSTLSLVFYVDTNGSKQPNMIGKDIFILVFKPETGNFVPAGNDLSEDKVLKDCSESGTGYFCLTLVKNRGWKVFEVK